MHCAFDNLTPGKGTEILLKLWEHKHVQGVAGLYSLHICKGFLKLSLKIERGDFSSEKVFLCLPFKGFLSYGKFLCMAPSRTSTPDTRSYCALRLIPKEGQICPWTQMRLIQDLKPQLFHSDL